MKRAHRGFTLVEVVVAFALLAVVLATVFEIFTRGMARAGEMEHYSRALVIAQSKLAAAGVEEALAEGEKRGTTEDGQYRWVVNVVKSPETVEMGRVQQAGYSLYRVETRVAWQGPTGTERDVALATLFVAQNK